MTIGANRELGFKTKLHKDVLTAIKSRRHFSETKMRNRFDVWRKMDEQAIGFIKETASDNLRQNAKKVSGVVDYTTIEIPYSFGMLMAAHTYWTSVFLARSPVLQYTARHGEPQQQVQAVEAIMNYQTLVGEMMAPFYIWLYDAGKYGTAVLGNFWDEQMLTVSEIVEKPQEFLGIPLPDKEPVKVKRTQQIAGYHGNRVYNIKPYQFLPDPRVPMSKLNDGEFCGRIIEVGWSAIATGEADGRYFNVRELQQRLKAHRRGSVERGSEHVDWPEPTDDTTMHHMDFDEGFVELTEMVVKIIPKVWKLGQSERPEKWVFTVGNEEVIIGARPLGEWHDRFPYYVIEQEIEGYSLFKRSIMEQVKPLNDAMTWLFNSHFYNVRAALNNQFIYDPARVVFKDLADKQPGKLIRLKPNAYGQDVRTMVQQLPVNDVTRSHIGDIAQVGELMQRASGVTDNIMGLLNEGGRKTATEVRTASSFSINRLKTVAEYMSFVGFHPLSQNLLQTTQQHYDLERQFRVTGDLSATTPFVDVSPEGIAGFFDYVPVDGTLPIDRFAQANLWKEILSNIQTMPGVLQQFDITGMFVWMAQLAGLRNINQFRIQLTQDQQLAAQAQAGNVVPLNQNQGAAPLQIPNIGPTA